MVWAPVLQQQPPAPVWGMLPMGMPLATDVLKLATLTMMAGALDAWVWVSAYVGSMRGQWARLLVPAAAIATAAASLQCCSQPQSRRRGPGSCSRGPGSRIWEWDRSWERGSGPCSRSWELGSSRERGRALAATAENGAGPTAGATGAGPQHGCCSWLDSNLTAALGLSTPPPRPCWPTPPLPMLLPCWPTPPPLPILEHAFPPALAHTQNT